jgi:hypothetical protein
VLGAVGFFFGWVSIAPAATTNVALTVSIPVGRPNSLRAPRGADERGERRLRLARYGAQLVDAVISAVGYHAYARCLSCLAYPGGGPLGARAVSMADFNGNLPAEGDPLVRPMAGGGILSLALGGLVYDLLDARIERHWSIAQRESADLAEIGAHAWGVSTWVPEVRNLHRAAAIAAACGAQWRARQYGQAFSEGCVSEFYRPAPGGPGVPVPSATLLVCAPAKFARGTVLFATAAGNVAASGTPCPQLAAPF